MSRDTKAKRVRNLSATMAKVAVLLPLLPLPALAQQFQYADLEQMFGEPVTMSAIGKPQRASEAPANIVIITADEIRRSGAYSIPQILQRIPGIAVLSENIAEQSVGGRGFNRPMGTRFLVALDGRGLFVDEYFRVDWSSMPVEIDEIQQIEVVMGPAGSLYGFNALLGVVNIITKDPLQQQVNSVSTRIGTQGFRNLSAVKSFRLSPDIAMRVALGYTLSDQFHAPGVYGAIPGMDERTTAIDSRNARRRSGKADMSWKLSEQSNLRLEGSWIENEQAQQWDIWAEVGYEVRNRNLRGTYGLESDLGLLSVTASITDADLVVTPNTNGIGQAYNQNTTWLKAENLVKLGADHTIRLATEFRGGKGKGDVYGPASARVIQDVYSASAMWNWDLASNWTLTNSLRWDLAKISRDGAGIPGVGYSNDDYKRTISTPSYNSYLTVKLTDQDTLRLSTGRAVQIPPMIEADLQNSFPDPQNPSQLLLLYRGNPNLPLTTHTNYEVTYDRRLALTDGSVRLSVWHQNVKGNHSLSTVPVNAAAGTLPLLFEFVQGSDSKANGVELSFDGRFAGIGRWAASYGLADVDDRNVETLNLGGASVIHHQALWSKTASKHRLHGSVGFSSGIWEGDLSASHYSARNAYGFNSSTLYHIAPYTIVDARLAAEVVDGLTLSIEGSNLLDAGHVESIGHRIERRMSVSAAYRF